MEEIIPYGVMGGAIACCLVLALANSVLAIHSFMGGLFGSAVWQIIIAVVAFWAIYRLLKAIDYVERLREK